MNIFSIRVSNLESILSPAKGAWSVQYSAAYRTSGSAVQVLDGTEFGSSNRNRYARHVSAIDLLACCWYSAYWAIGPFRISGETRYSLRDECTSLTCIPGARSPICVVPSVCCVINRGHMCKISFELRSHLSRSTLGGQVSKSKACISAASSTRSGLREHTSHYNSLQVPWRCDEEI